MYRDRVARPDPIDCRWTLSDIARMRQFFGYWWLVVKLAWKEWLGSWSRGLIAGTAVAVVTNCLQFRYGIHTWGQVMGIIKTSIGSYLLVYGAAFLWKLLCFPAKLDQEKDEKYKKSQDEAEKKAIAEKEAQERAQADLRETI